jgi:hypothetical protein
MVGWRHFLRELNIFATNKIIELSINIYNNKFKNKNMKNLLLILVVLFTVVSCSTDAIPTEKQAVAIDKGDVRPPGSQH